MQPPENLATRRSLIEKMAGWLRPILRRSVTPIVVQDGEEDRQHGTGTFFRIGDASFLLTAGHVWKDAKRSKRQLSIFAIGGSGEGEQRLKKVPLAGRWYSSPDSFDVALIELERSVAECLGACHFLHLTDVRLWPAAPGWCWVYGFPTETCAGDSSLLRFNELFLGAPFNQQDLTLENHDQDLHFLLDADRNDLWLSNGTRADLPTRLDGMSGCPIWQSIWPNQDLDAPWDCRCARIVGVQTSYYRQSSVIKATPWVAVAHIIRRVRPDLRKILDLNFGAP
jgi:hypothetical protein